tara:strand:+ start:460 stop:723 length:264 start_codon:yes stop_codon:yes gene_type:complete
MSEIIKKLPCDLVSNNILPFIMQKCNNCSKKNFYFDYQKNIKLKLYNSVFDDDFYFSGEFGDIYEFKILCNKCYISYLNKYYYRVLE